MITLFIDTSSTDVSIAILKDQLILANITKSIPNQHSIYTVSFIEECIQKAKVTVDDIEKILVVNGPGSFTGLRIGVTIAKVYAYLKNIPIVVVSSLKMLALSAHHDYCLALIDAHHDHYYFGLYDLDHHEVIPEQFGTKAQVLELISKYQPVVVCNENIVIDQKKILKQSLNIGKIVSYYQEQKGEISHLVVPNYLKLPQALEERND